MAAPVAPGPVAAAEAPVTLASWLGFLAMCVGMFMAILDIQIVASSLAEIQAGLRIRPDQLSWIQTSYLIAEIIAIPLTGWLTRLLSLRYLFLVALTCFTLASVACAASGSFAWLIVSRVVQGFSGGILIPAVFTAIFALFPPRLHARATALAGLFAMLAPTLGPLVGGYITETYSWPWLFLINLGPGILAAVVGFAVLRTEARDRRALYGVDLASLALFAVCLASLQIALKEAPQRGWADPYTLLLLALCLGSGHVAIRRCLARPHPIVDLRIMREPAFVTSCFHSFVVGAGAYGSIYLLSLFLAYVREHSAFEIGVTMIVAGVAQLLAVPIAIPLVSRVDPRILTVTGLGLFALGLLANGGSTWEWDFSELFWPQVLRGVGLMLCLLPTTAVALEGLHGERLANASGLFNLMRNLGGAIWIALIDTILELRPAVHGQAIAERLAAGDRETARFVGLPLDRFQGVPLGPVDEATREAARPLVERAAAVASFNEAWIVLGLFFALSLLAVWPLRRR